MSRPKKSSVFNPFKYIFAIYMPFFIKAIWTNELGIPLMSKRGGEGEVLTLSDPLIPFITIPFFIYGVYYFGKRIKSHWKYVEGFEAKTGAIICVPFSLLSVIFAYNEANNFIIFVFSAIGAFGFFAVEFNASNET